MAQSDRNQLPFFPQGQSRLRDPARRTAAVGDGPAKATVYESAAML